MMRKLGQKPMVSRERISRPLMFDPTPAGLVTQKSLRKAYKSEWARIRARHFKEGNFGCEICNVVETEARLIHAHEVYAFPNNHNVRLEKIIFICTRCHDAIHLERTRVHCGAPYIQRIEAHYCEVNGGLSTKELKQDFVDSWRRGLEIREFYGGSEASPDLDYGAYQVATEQCDKRKRKSV